MIRKIIYTLCIPLNAISSFAQPNVEFDTKKIDFGTILEGTINPFRFHYKNIGNQPFSISNVSVTCGCTAPVWSKKELLPGDTASIYIEFNSANKLGPVSKGVNLMTNCPSPLIGLLIYANIIPDSNFVTLFDSLSYKPLKIAHYKSYNQVIVSFKTLQKKGFNGTLSEAEELIPKIIKSINQPLYEIVWVTSENGLLMINMLDKKFEKEIISIFKKEILNKKRLKFWVKKI
jgi:hypothetical protein